jgi:hypothetical protein
VTSVLGYATWTLLLIGALVLWVLSHTTRGPAVARPSVVVTRLATGPCLRVLLVLAWMWAGWHLFAR